MPNQVIPVIPTEDELVEELVQLISDAYVEAILEDNCEFKVSSKPGANDENYVEIQYCYDEEYGRFFIEFELSTNIKRTLPWERIIASIHNYINDNFYKTTHVFPEIIAYDDGVNERYDSVTKLSPYTIGYWDCLHGHYEFLYSHQVFMDHMAGLNIPDWNEEFLKEMDENFNTYYHSDYETFVDNMVKIRAKYKISADQPPEKKIEDFAAKIKTIYDKYITELSEKDKTAYIQECMNVNGDPKKVKELNIKYGIGDPIWTKIPKMMDEYKVIYKDFFGVDLHDFISNTKIFYIIQSFTEE